MTIHNLKHSQPIVRHLRTALIGLLIVSSSALAQTSAQIPTSSYTLRAALEALPRSAAWLAADRTVEVAQRNTAAARGAALSVNATSDLSRVAGSSSTPEFNVVQFTGSFGATASLAVAPWSPVFDALRVAERGLARAELDRLEARSLLIAESAQRYFDARQAAKQATLALDTLELQTKRLAIIKQQLELRTATLADLRSGEAGLEAARAGLRAAQQSADLARRALFVGLGVPVPSEVAFVTAPIPRALPSLETLQAGLAAALPKRSDVRRAQLGVAEALDAVSIATRERLLPQANLSLTLGGATATGQPTGAQASASFNLPNGSVSVSGNYGFGSPPVAATQLSLNLSLSLPLIAPAADGRIRAVQSALEAARLALEQTLGSAELDVWRGYNAADAAAQQVRVAQANLELTKQRLSDTERRVALELASTTDLGAARIAVQQSEADLESALSAALIAAVRLEVALGKTDLTALVTGENQ